MRCSVIVLTWNGGAAALACLESLARLDPAPERVLVVDNGSTDGTPEAVAAGFAGFELLQNGRNLGFAAGMNAGIRHSLASERPPETVILLNQDTAVDRGWLGAILAPLAAEPRVAAVGCKIRYPDGTIQHAGVTLEQPRALARHVGWHEPDRGQHDAPCDAEFLTGAALALRVAALEQVGLLDEGFTPAYFEDLDLCVRLRLAGYRLRYEPKATLTHHESLSVRDELVRSAMYNRGRLRFVLKRASLDELTGPFAAAEYQYLRRHAAHSESRALRWAYAETLASLPELLATRYSEGRALPDTAEATLRPLLLDLRRELARASYATAYTRAEQIATL